MIDQDKHLSLSKHVRVATIDETVDKPFLVKESLSYTSRNKREMHSVEKKRHLILKTIGETPNKTIYFYGKKTKTPYPAIHRAMKELVFCRLVCCKPGFDSNGNPCDLFFIPEITGEFSQDNQDPAKALHSKNEVDLK